MIWAITYFIGAIVCLFFGGCLRGLFECVILFDSVDDWKGPYWAFKLFASDKDRNKDGKVSFWERNFPNDGGHRAKLFELNLYSIASILLAISVYYASELIESLPYWVVIIAAPLVAGFLWWVKSFSFLVSFNKYRKAPSHE